MQRRAAAEAARDGEAAAASAGQLRNGSLAGFVQRGAVLPGDVGVNATGGGARAATEAAEARLQRVLTKQSFQHMTVLGQFNKGFIVGKLGLDLFILDQHACDEKYNFERLQAETTIHQQPLLAPRRMELTAVEEMTIVDHLPIFEKNGFRFLVDHGAAPTQRLRLSALPFSKGTQFNEDDVHELASLLMETPGRMVRLPKARAMFASRACRSSIMIGTDLKHEVMVREVRRLTGLHQPWNCPHGRPTLRHLAVLQPAAASLQSSPAADAADADDAVMR